MLKNCSPIRALIALLALATAHCCLAVDFVHEVMPVLKEHCGKCHVGEKKKGGLSFNTRAALLSGGENGKIVTPGKPDDSLFIQLLESTDDDEWMPPKGPRVPKEAIAVLRRWVAEGLVWEPGVSLGESSWEPPLQPREVALPASRNGRNHPVDRLLDADLAKRGAPTPPPISDAAFLRRLSFDLVGLPPSAMELQEFLSDAKPDKRSRAIDRLLANDVAYADHWLTMWNDLLRNDYTGTGFITGGRKQITGWLYDSLRDNKPYDKFVRELISPNQHSAGFINGIKWRGEVNASQTREIQFSQNISQVFLGINMKCASCHDSFIDRWKLSEAYNLAAIYADKPMELNRCDKPTGQMATPKWIFPELGDVDPKAPKAKRLEQLAGLMTHPDNGRFTRTVVNRLWHRLMGRGIVHPVDAMDTKPWNEDLLDYLATHFAKDGHDLRSFIRFVVSSQAYQSEAAILTEDPGPDYVYAGPLAKRMTAEQLLDAIWAITETNPKSATANVTRHAKAPEEAAPKDPKLAPIQAKWIWSPGKDDTKATLTHTFELPAKPKSATLVATCDNAFELSLNGWLGAKSKDWQQAVAVDVTDHLVVGKNSITVKAEMFGGSKGFIGQFNIVTGEGLRVVATDSRWQSVDAAGGPQAVAVMADHGAAPWGPVLDKAKPGAPTLPAPPIRAALIKNDFLMRSLGRPHRDQVVTTRPGELTTLQAIDLANGETLSNYLNLGAQQMVKKGQRQAAIIDWLYLSALARPPSAAEREVLAEIVGDQNQVAVADLLWSVFMLPEFQIIR